MTANGPARPDIENLIDALREVDSETYTDLVTRFSGITATNRIRRLSASVSQARSIAGELLAETRWDSLTRNEVQSITSKVEAVRGALLSLGVINAETSGLAGQINQATDVLEPAVSELRLSAILYLAYLRSSRWSDLTSNYESALMSFREATSAESQALQSEARKVLEEVVADRVKVAEALGAAEDALKAAREASGSAAIAAHASTFSNEAHQAEAAARRWLIAAVVITAITGVVAAVLFLAWDQDGSASEAHNLQVILLKTFAVSAGIYFAAIAVRVFRAQMHIAVTNRHRANALTTYNAFASSTPAGTDAHEKLLLEAAHTIFGHTPSGLIEHAGDSVEILDGVSSLIRKN